MTYRGIEGLSSDLWPLSHLVRLGPTPISTFLCSLTWGCGNLSSHQVKGLVLGLWLSSFSYHSPPPLSHRDVESFVHQGEPSCLWSLHLTLCPSWISYWTLGILPTAKMLYVGLSMVCEESQPAVLMETGPKPCESCFPSSTYWTFNLPFAVLDWIWSNRQCSLPETLSQPSPLWVHPLPDTGGYSYL